MKKFLFLAIATFFAATPAFAGSVGLKCILDTKNGPQEWSINLNEDAGTVTFAHPLATGRSPALFTPTEVIWGDGDLRINRTTLIFVRDLKFGGRSLGIDYGKCELQKQERAF